MKHRDVFQRVVWSVAAAAVLFACNNSVAGLGPPSDPATETFAPALNVDLDASVRLPTGVYVQDITVGNGDTVSTSSDTVWVTYAGFLKDGDLFDSGTNTRFLFGPLGLVKGFHDGILGMRVGGRRKLVIPSDQGYGAVSRRNLEGEITVPRQSTLIFDVQLLRVHTPEPDGGPVSIRKP
jgi:FKBP-type peptidyl-prolyl cis-trans isomerase FkpA